MQDLSFRAQRGISCYTRLPSRTRFLAALGMTSLAPKAVEVVAVYLDAVSAAVRQLFPQTRSPDSSAIHPPSSMDARASEPADCRSCEPVRCWSSPPSRNPLADFPLWSARSSSEKARDRDRRNERPSR